MERLRELLREILPDNPFYARKLAGCDPDQLPFTTKAELIADQNAHPPYGSNLTLHRSRYPRMHQTSGTSSGQPMRWLDTQASWNALLGIWTRYFQWMGVTEEDRLFFPFSFGPFLGFWSAFESASRQGFSCLPGGGMSSVTRLHFLKEHEVTTLCCTPSYALHLAEVAKAEGVTLADTAVNKILVAGEPGGSIPATRERIESEWNARVIDHYGLTEVGAVATEWHASPRNVFVDGESYLVEMIDPVTALPLPQGSVGELVITNLFRVGSPLIRYRTGDLVRLEVGDGPASPNQPLFRGGILGRADEMLHVRGNNVYPSAIEGIVRRFPGVAEYRLIYDQSEALADLCLEIEPDSASKSENLGERIRDAIRRELLFRVEVSEVAAGTLPRFEMKAKRLVRKK